MPFKTNEISNPRFESNNLRFITVNTPNLNGRGDICVYVPAGTKQSDTLPIVILLHGVYGSAWSWSHSAGVHLTAGGLIANGELPPMIIAMPSDGLWGDGSGYLPHHACDFEKWIAEDVPMAVRENITGAKKESPLFISGLSMGGFGALRIGAKYGHLFKAISGMSSITGLPQMKHFTQEPLKHYGQDNAADEDVFTTFERHVNQLPPVRFDCGADDLLIKYNRHLHQKMLEAGMPHIYEEYDGGHEWAYWAKHVVTTLQFFASHL
jgi:enterochelin esterase-like enzyme